MRKTKCAHDEIHRLPSGRCGVCSRENYARRKSRPDWATKQRLWILNRSRKSRGQPDPLYAATEKCECCNKDFGKRGPQLDHCHSTGCFRGWLCSECNMGIGKLGDTFDAISMAYDYLSRCSAKLAGEEKCALLPQ